MKSCFLPCLCLVLLLTGQCLTTELLTEASGQQKEIADGRLFDSEPESPENGSIDAPAHAYPSNQSCLSAEENRRLQTEQPVTLDLFPMDRLSAYKHQPDCHLDRETLDDSSLLVKKRFETSTSSNQDKRKKQKHDMQDFTSNLTFPSKDKQPMESTREKSLHSIEPDGALSDTSNRKNLKIFGVHHLEHVKESPRQKMWTGSLIQFTCRQTATRNVYQLIKTLKDEVAGISPHADGSSRKEYIFYNVIHHITVNYHYQQGKPYHIQNQIFCLSVNMADEILFKGETMPSLIDVLTSLDVKEESNAENILRDDDPRKRYKITLTKSFLTFTLLSISLLEEKEILEEKVIFIILNYLKSFYKDVENGNYMESHWKRLKNILTGKKGSNAPNKNMNDPKRKLAMCWHIVCFLMEEKSMDLIPNHADFKYYSKQISRAINKIIFFSANKEDDCLEHHEIN